MTTDLVVVAPETPVPEVARRMIARDISGVPVILQDGTLVGLVREEDLIVRDADIHPPRYIQFLDSIIYLGSLKPYEEEVRKDLATTAGELMHRKPRSIGPDADISELATLMVEQRVNPVPVVEGNNHLIGIVSRADLVRLLVQEETEARA